MAGAQGFTVISRYSPNRQLELFWGRNRMLQVTKFRSNIPRDMQVFEHEVELAVNKHVHAAKSFARRHKRRIYLDHVTDHIHSQGAIRVIGKSKGWFFERDECIGYVPADIANKLVRTDMEDKVEVRLKTVSIDGRRSIEIRFDILGPKDDYNNYSCVS